MRDSFITLYSTARSHIQCWQSTTLLDIFTYLALIVPRLLWNCRDARSFSPSANFINIGCRIRYYYLKSITAYLLSLHLFHHHWFSWNNIKCYWGLFSSSFSVRYLFILGKHLIEENSSWIMFLVFYLWSFINIYFLFSCGLRLKSRSNLVFPFFKSDTVLYLWSICLLLFGTWWNSQQGGQQ